MSVWTTNGGIFLGQVVEELFYDPIASRIKSYWQPTLQHNLYTGSRHLITIGPNGSGKTRKLLVPNLYRLTNWSSLVIDPKGELAVWTAKHRADAGSEIVTLDPFGVIEKRYPDLVEKQLYLKSIRFNPMAMLDPNSDDFPDEAKALGEALIKVEGNDAHWGKSAQALVTGLIMGLRMTLEKDDPKNSLAGVRLLLGLAPEALGHSIKEIIRDTGSENAIAAKLSRFTVFDSGNKELLSILSTAITQTDWLDSKPIQRALSGGAFDFSKMKLSPVTVYLVLPLRYLESHSSWLRLMITAVLTPLIRSTAKGVPVLLMLDEFAQLGRLEVIERNMALMRGYGVKLWVILQDLSQLKDGYAKRWESFIGNAGIIQSFAPQDMTTREYLAKLSGKRLYWLTPRSTSYSESQSLQNGYVSGSGSLSRSTQEGSTHYIDSIYPEQDLAQMNEEQSVLFEANYPPRRTILHDPSNMWDDTGIIFRKSDAFAAQYDVEEQVKSCK
ncbi:MAG: type IV secretory system conjugative DNA transfer family protein [Burkholderiales bacterium]